MSYIIIAISDEVRYKIDPGSRYAEYVKELHF